MFRQVFLTFHGERRGTAAPAALRPRRTPITVTRHIARPHLHDAPPAMALALVVLAIGSVLAGYVGWPHALGGHNLLGEWLHPSFTAHVEGARRVQRAGRRCPERPPE